MPCNKKSYKKGMKAGMKAGAKSGVGRLAKTRVYKKKK